MFDLNVLHCLGGTSRQKVCLDARYFAQKFLKLGLGSRDVACLNLESFDILDFFLDLVESRKSLYRNQ